MNNKQQLAKEVTEEVVDMQERVEKLEREVDDLYKERELTAVDYEARIQALKAELQNAKDKYFDVYLKADRYESAFKMLYKEIREGN